MNTTVITDQIAGPKVHTDNGIHPKTAVTVKQMRIQNNLLISSCCWIPIDANQMTFVTNLIQCQKHPPHWQTSDYAQILRVTLAHSNVNTTCKIEQFSKKQNKTKICNKSIGNSERYNLYFQPFIKQQNAMH